MSPIVFEISLIVATFNRCHSLARLLKSLECLELPDAGTLEGLVVDNDSSDGTRGLLLEKQQRSLKYSLTILHEPQRGKSAALNLGLKNCRGKIICVVDDDVILDSQWIRGVMESHQICRFDALQGRVLPGVDPFGNTADPNRLTGTNMSFKRGVFERVGFFDIRLGPGASGFSEDTEFSRRIRAAGFNIGYTPYPVVYHELDPARYGRRYNRAVQHRKGLSRSIYREESMFGKVLPELVGNCFKFCIYAALGKTGKLYRAEGRILRGLGYLQGRVGASKGRE
ncbi:MAG: glycosyltransferase [Deltaproteobacteria bacterium]|nr:glycosyltransferase [Deltaproteobacteria bacterium]